MKRTLCILIAIMLLLGLFAVPSFADSKVLSSSGVLKKNFYAYVEGLKDKTADEPEIDKYAADVLYNIGLFSGTGKDAQERPIYSLSNTATRAEAVTMIIRLLGKTDEAVTGTYDNKFTDVPTWAEPYVGYAYETGITAGISETKFGSSDSVSASQYMTFLLRALGYTTDEFKWNAAWEFTDEIGMTAGEYNADTKSFDRGDMVMLSYEALCTKLKGLNKTLLDSLKEDGTVAKDASVVLPAKDLKVTLLNPMDWNGSYFERVAAPEGDAYINGAYVTKCGDGFVFDFSIDAGKNTAYVFYPTGLGAEGKETEDYIAFEEEFGKWHVITKIDSKADTVSIYIPYDYIFKSVVNVDRSKLYLTTAEKSIVIRFFRGQDITDLYILGSDLPK